MSKTKSKEKPVRPEPPETDNTQPPKVPVPPEIEAATVVLFEGLWYDVTLKIRGNEVIGKVVGPGDLMRMSIERAVARLVASAETQRDGRLG
jgi:hypothetical protein